MFWESGIIKGPVYPNRTSAWFDKFIEEHQPEEWYAGRWHQTMKHTYNNTKFMCIGTLDYVDVEL